jgi:hypothetical protein
VWRELIQSLCTDCKFNEPTSQSRLDVAKETLGIDLPLELYALLLESDGVCGEYGLGLIWPLERIEADNNAFRANVDFRHLYMPFDHLLFFADAGNGDQFAFAINDKVIRRPDIFAWDHENDSRIWVAPSLQKYLEWWLTGVINL